MRLFERYKLRKNRKYALNNIADYWLAVEAQRLQSVPQAPQQPYTVFAPSSRLAPGDAPAQSFNPMEATPPPPVTNVRTEPDPVIAQSVAQLSTELDREDAAILTPPAVRTARMDAINRRMRG